MEPTAGAPVLSTPDTHIFEDVVKTEDQGGESTLSEEQLMIRYEIERTVAEIKAARYKRIALQLPDNMLRDAPAVFRHLEQRLKQKPLPNGERKAVEPKDPHPELFILGDTSYGACCVDEVAAEHVDADVVVHYGRACLTPTSRLPVVYVFTKQPVNRSQNLLDSFRRLYPDKKQKVMLMSDAPFQHALDDLCRSIQDDGYANIYGSFLEHAPSSPIPNRSLPGEVGEEPAKLKEWHLFHISEPPDALLLTLSSLVASINIYPTSSIDDDLAARAVSTSTSSALRRRYALVTSITTVPIFGILINTLSARNYLQIIEDVKKRIAVAGKKSYSFVVGKVNAAKVANFSEIGAWVAIGCLESSLIDSKDFWKPVITPYELTLALAGDNERVWTGYWTTDNQRLLDSIEPGKDGPALAADEHTTDTEPSNSNEGGYDSEPESAPPEFDLRTGKYISSSRPMRSHAAAVEASDTNGYSSAQLALTKPGPTDVIAIGGHAAPGADYLRTQRTWTGLGSDFEIQYEGEGGAIEEGRSGIARGYNSENARPSA